MKSTSYENPCSLGSLILINEAILAHNYVAYSFEENTKKNLFYRNYFLYAFVVSTAKGYTSFSFKNSSYHRSNLVA